MHNNTWTQNGLHRPQFVGHSDAANGQTVENHRPISLQCMSLDNQLFPLKESYWLNQQALEGQVSSEELTKAKILRYLLVDDAGVQLNLQVENSSSLEQIHPTPQTTSRQVVQSLNQNILNSSSNMNMQQNVVQNTPTSYWFLKPVVTGSEQLVTQKDSSHTTKSSAQQGNAQTTLLGNRTKANPQAYASIMSAHMSHSGTAATVSSISPIPYNQSCNQRHISGQNIKMIQNEPFPNLSNLLSPCQPLSNTQGITSILQSRKSMPMQSISNKYNGTNALPSTHSLTRSSGSQYTTNPSFPKTNWNLTKDTGHTVHHTGNSSGNVMPGNVYTKQPYTLSSDSDKKQKSSLCSYGKRMAEQTSTMGHNSLNGPQGIISHSVQPLTTTYLGAASSQQHIRDVPSSLNPVQQSYYVTVTEDKSGNGYKANKVMFLGNDKMLLQVDPQGRSSNKLLAGKMSKQQLIVQTIPSTISSVEVNDFAYQKSSGPTGEKAVAVVQPLSQTSNQAISLCDCLENVCTTTDKPVTNLNNHVDRRENDHQSIRFPTKSGKGDSTTLRADIRQTRVTTELSDILLFRPKSPQCLNSGGSQLLDDEQCQVTQPPQEITQVPARDIMIETRKGTSNIDSLSSVPVIQWTNDKILKLIEEVEKANQQDNYPDINVVCKIISLYWENSQERLIKMIKTGAYQNVMTNVHDFCQKHVKLDTIILDSVIDRQLSQLEDKCHVLQHDSVYPKMVYKSSWMNTNEQIDEFGFPWALKYGHQITVREDEQKLCKVDNCNHGNTGVMHSEVLNVTERDNPDVNKAAMQFQYNANTTQNEEPITDGREEELKADEAENGNLVCTVNKMHYEVLTPTIRHEQPKPIETDDGIQPNTTEMQSKVDIHSEPTPTSDEDCETQSSSVFHSFTQTSFSLKSEMANISDDPFSSIEIHVLPPEEAVHFFGETLFPKKRENPQQNDINGSEETLPKALHLNQLKLENNVDDSMQEFCCLSRLMEVNGVAGEHLLRTCQCRSKHGPTMPILNSPEKGAEGTVAIVGLHMAMPKYKLELSAEEKTRDNCGDAIDTKHSQGEQCTELTDLAEHPRPSICGLLSSSSIEIDSDDVYSRNEAEMASAMQSELDCGQYKQLDYSQKIIEHGQKQTISLEKVNSPMSESTSGVKSCDLELHLSEKISYLASLSLRQNCKQRNYPKISKALMNAKKVQGGKRKRLFECQSQTLSVKTTMDSKPTLEPTLTGRHVHKQSHERRPSDDFEAVPCNVKTAKLALFGSLPQRKHGTVQTGHSNNRVSFRATSFPDRPPLPPQILIVVVSTSSEDCSSDTVAMVKSPVKKRIFEDWANSFVPTKKARESKSAFKNGQVFRQEVLKKAEANKPPHKSNTRLKNEKRAKGEPERHINKQLLLRGLKLRVEKSKMGISKSKRSISDTKSLHEMGNPALMPLQQNSCLMFSVLPKSFNFSDSGKPKESISADGSDPVKKSKAKTETSKGAWATDCEKGYFTSSSNTRKTTTSLFQEFQKKFTEKR